MLLRWVQGPPTFLNPKSGYTYKIQLDYNRNHLYCRVYDKMGIMKNYKGCSGKKTH